MSKKPNPIIETYKGVNIRAINEVKISFGPVHFKRIIDEVDKTGLPIPKLLAYSGKPCEKCKDVCVVIFDKEGELVHIKRGLFHIPQSNGISILQKAKNRDK
jgi:hypothetical protein